MSYVFMYTDMWGIIKVLESLIIKDITIHDILNWTKYNSQSSSIIYDLGEVRIIEACLDCVYILL